MKQINKLFGSFEVTSLMTADVGSLKGSHPELTVPGAVGLFQFKTAIWGKRWSFPLPHSTLTPNGGALPILLVTGLMKLRVTSICAHS